jgi:UDP-N-acetylglucosamine--N-acetylmuramyl-(pentapeptide) pyrophosphoryl-undecaprenol N-acetylglucosamine transferase
VALTGALAELQARIPRIHIIHQTGEKDYTACAAEYLKAGVSAEVSPFIDDMPAAFTAADVIVCRSGASTVAEVTAAAKPAIFVPLPTAADDHQRKNAETLARGGAAILVSEKDFTPEKLAALVTELFGDRTRLQKMSAAARSMSHEDAAGHIAAIAARVAGVKASAGCPSESGD